jgi:hypothetical protein
LHRSADPSGLSNWSGMLAAGVSLEQVEADIAGSGEYFQTRAGGTNNGFLNAFYQDALGRTPDQSGLSSWGQALASGVSRAQVAAEIFTSPEFQQDLVQSFYQQYLGRPADPSGLSFWLSTLQQGMTDRQIVAAIVGSQEYLSRVG